MRLTLRTMLAYLDDILEPSDAKELGQKIEESKFANDLVHRIRNSVRRLRLGAPKVEGRGMGLDPNTVAEYLDNTMPPEHVPEFERVCLESDVHLAEVAACHQVLTIVLGEPAEINADLRERIYGIGHGVGQSSLAEGVPAGVAEQAPSAGTEERTALDSGERLERQEGKAGEPAGAMATSRVASPDSPRADSRLPIVSLLMTLACGFVLVVVALRAMGPFGPEHPVWRFLAPGNRVVAEGQHDGDPAMGTQPGPTAQPSAASSSSAMEGESASQSPVLGDSAGTDRETPKPSPPVRLASSGQSSDVKLPPATPSSEKLDLNAKPQAKQPPAADTGHGSGLADQMPGSNVPTAAESSTPEPKTPASVGRFISEEQVLARWDLTAKSWFRLAPDAPLAAADRLLSLPTYRPQMLLMPHTKISFSGETRGQVAASSEPETPCLAIEYGRVAVVSVADRGTKIRFEFGKRNGIAILPDAESELAVEVLPDLSPGIDPLETAGLPVVVLYAANGEVTWGEEATEPVNMGAGQALELVGDRPGKLITAGTRPAWIEGKELSDIDRRASQELKQHLVTDRPLSLSLSEKVGFRQAEVRALACRCLSCLDLFEPILEALNDESQHSYWNAHYDMLRFSLARSRESASRLVDSLKNVQSEDAPAIYRLIWGFSPSQLEEGQAKTLIDSLEHKSMIVRVLAFENLRRITGKTLLFRPEQPPGQEKRQVSKWRKSLEDGEIRYRASEARGASPPGVEPPTGPNPKGPDGR